MNYCPESIHVDERNDNGGWRRVLPKSFTYEISRLVNTINKLTCVELTAPLQCVNVIGNFIYSIRAAVRLIV